MRYKPGGIYNNFSFYGKTKSNISLEKLESSKKIL
jgi:hypothetical protein